jgi:hypothetical protein
VYVHASDLFNRIFGFFFLHPTLHPSSSLGPV